MYTIAANATAARIPRPERIMMFVQEEIEQQVSKSAAVMETALTSRFDVFGTGARHKKRDLAVYKHKHGQYDGAGVCGAFASNRNQKHTEKELDDHHSPLRASEYLRLRAQPMVEFYQSRVPRYYCSRVVVKYLLVMCALSSPILAFMKLAIWASVGTAITGRGTHGLVIIIDYSFSPSFTANDKGKGISGRRL